MIKDLELIKDITPLFEKKIVIWGMGHAGNFIFQELIAMGAGKRGIYLCDSNDTKFVWGGVKINMK